jgi:uncharacterized membrane protein
VDEVNVAMSATDGFGLKNQGLSVDQQVQMLADIIAGRAGTKAEQAMLQLGISKLPGSPIPAIPGSSQAFGTNSTGTIIVGTSTSSATFNEAFRWQSPTLSSLGDLTGGTFSSTAYAVSADGSTAVGQGESANGPEAFLRKTGLPIQALGDLTGGAFSSSARAVSADGSVVVGVGTIAASSGANEARGFKWTETGGMQPLATLSGGNGSGAFGISQDGRFIVGTSTALVDTGVVVLVNTAVLWANSTTPTSIHALLSNAGVNLSDWTLESADGISADGNVIVGSGTLNGVKQGWVLSGLLELFQPPEVPLPLISLQITGPTLKVIHTTNAGLVYQVERSPDLGSWAPLGPAFTAATAGNREVVDPDVNPTTASPSKFFYRVRASYPTP